MTIEPDINTLLKSVKGVPPGTAAKLEKIGIKTIGDILWHFPVRYEDWTDPAPVEDLVPGKDVVLKGRVGKSFTRRMWQRKLSITEVELISDNCKIKVLWFNQPYVKYGFAEGNEMVVSGRVGRKNKDLIIINPSYEIVGGTGHKIGSIVPVYSRPKGVSSEMIGKIVRKVIGLSDKMPEFIPEKVLLSRKIPTISDAVVKAHFPSSVKEGNEARRRFSFEALFLIQLINRISKKRLLEMTSPKIEVDIEEIKKLLSLLPFELTLSQKRSLWEILKDISSGRPMNRLLQGDVGSGKTVVAAIAAITAAKSGYQSAIMAPTEILAEQHYLTIKKMFPETGLCFGLMTSGTSRIFMGDGLESEMKKSEMTDLVKNKKVDIIIGTHSLIAKRKSSSGAGEPVIKPENIGLVIIDEQHRFGVKERAMLVKGSSSSVPHFLSMSATPIPRTMAIALFGDLDMSFIDELPKGRKKVVTKWVSPENRLKAYGFIRKEIIEGRQVFVVCPKIGLIENDEEEIAAQASSWSEVKNVQEEFDRLSSKIFPGMKIGMLHGKMSSEDKEKVMSSFKKGDLSVLVCTSVVEVGIDVPNATVMLIEDAERFGLAQLYQFKGRVGRGEHQSYCLLFSKTSSDIAKDRLKALSEAKNGLELAEKDLSLRGPGELLGDSQKGIPDMTMNALRDKDLIRESREAADMVMNEGLLIEEFAPLKKKLDSLREQFHLE